MYNQHFKHSKNHRKDKYYQQCGFHFEESTESGASIAARTANFFRVIDMKTNEILFDNISDEDTAVDFVLGIKDKWCGIFTDGGICVMK